MSRTDDEIEDSSAPLIEHLAELRTRLIRAVLYFVVGFIVAFVFAGALLDWLLVPIEASMRSLGQPQPGDAVHRAAGILLHPGPDRHGRRAGALLPVRRQPALAVRRARPLQDRKGGLPAVPDRLAGDVHCSAALFAHFVVTPLAMQFFLGFADASSIWSPPSSTKCRVRRVLTAAARSAGIDIVFQGKVNETLDITLKLIVAFGLSFQLPVLLTLMGRAGWPPPPGLAGVRKYAVVGILTLAAVVTPPDVITQVILFTVVYGLYEISILLVRRFEKTARGRAARPRGCGSRTTTRTRTTARQPGKPAADRDEDEDPILKEFDDEEEADDVAQHGEGGDLGDRRGRRGRRIRHGKETGTQATARTPTTIPARSTRTDDRGRRSSVSPRRWNGSRRRRWRPPISTPPTAFVWHVDPDRLEPVARVNRVDLSLLVGVDRARDILLDNTRQFARGLPANNALLWGARGMGKSSLVKAVHAAVTAEGTDAQARRAAARGHRPPSAGCWPTCAAAPHRFVLFCDDLSFSHDDQHYKSLKAVLDGGIEGRPENVVFYATSNRRHLMPRDMIENERHSAINPAEAVEEKVSLSRPVRALARLPPLQPGRLPGDDPRLLRRLRDRDRRRHAARRGDRVAGDARRALGPGGLAIRDRSRRPAGGEDRRLSRARGAPARAPDDLPRPA